MCTFKQVLDYLNYIIFYVSKPDLYTPQSDNSPSGQTIHDHAVELRNHYKKEYDPLRE
jgi:hypothetical protein